MLEVAATAADDALAADIVALDVTALTPFSDTFLIATVDNPRHMRATMNAVSEAVKKDSGNLPNSVEGDGDAEWVILDYGDLVVHLFTEEGRSFYALEKLWGDAPRLRFGADQATPV